MYAFYKHEGNLELITTANLLVGMSYVMLEWSRRIINMLLYENREILTLVSIGVTLASSCHGNANTLFTLSLTRPSPKLPSPVWPWPGEPSDLQWLGIVHCWRTIPFTFSLTWAFAEFYLKLHIEHMNKKARSARVCVYT